MCNRPCSFVAGHYSGLCATDLCHLLPLFSLAGCTFESFSFAAVLSRRMYFRVFLICRCPLSPDVLLNLTVCYLALPFLAGRAFESIVTQQKALANRAAFAFKLYKPFCLCNAFSVRS